MSDTILLDAALAYAARGIPVLPCWKGKGPRTLHGVKDATTNRDQITKWWSEAPDALIGIATGGASGIVVLDLDRKKGKDGFAAVPEWEELSPVRVKTVNGGAHIYFRATGNVRGTTGADGVDIKADGGYVIAPPSPGYEFICGDNFDPSRLPPWPGFGNLTPQGVTGLPKARIEELEAALKVIPNSEANWEYWNTAGMAIWMATGGTEQGFALFDSWSRKASVYDEMATRARWNHYPQSPPNRITAGTLFYWADQADPEWRRSLKHQNKADLVDLIYPLPTHKHGEPAGDPIGWLVRNRLQKTGAGLLLGQWGTYKTFVGLDLCAHIICGWDWTGEPVYRRGGVLIFAAEGAGGVALRLAALVEKKIIPRLAVTADESDIRLDPSALPIEWADTCPMLLGADNPLQVMIATAKAAHDRFMEMAGLPLALVLIDTLSVSAGWDDENDNAAAARVMALLRELSRQTDALVIGIDHLGKAVEAGARGASAKEANSDVVLAILADKPLNGKVSNTRLAMRKLRDGPQGEEYPFEARVVSMGPDEEGQEVTSITIDWNVTRSPRARPRSASSSAFDQALTQILSNSTFTMPTARGPIRAAPSAEVREAFRKCYDPEGRRKKSANDQRFRECLNAAFEAGDILVLGEGQNKLIGRPEKQI